MNIGPLTFFSRMFVTRQLLIFYTISTPAASSFWVVQLHAVQDVMRLLTAALENTHTHTSLECSNRKN